jgi:hypothetical protein
MMKLSCVSVLFLLTPLIFTPAEDDSSYTDAWFAAAGGRFAEPGCNSTIERPFQELGAKISHKSSSPFRYGMQMGIAHFGGSRNAVGVWAWPELALDTKYFSLGTMGMRIGSLDNMYVNAGLFNGVPQFAHGVVELGVGGKLNGPLSRFWVGATGLPYMALGPTARLDFPLGDAGGSLFVLGHYGNYLGHNEYALGLGYRLRSR